MWVCWAAPVPETRRGTLINWTAHKLQDTHTPLDAPHCLDDGNDGDTEADSGTGGGGGGCSSGSATAGDTHGPLRQGPLVTVQRSPADTMMRSGLNSYAMGMMSWWKAAM